MKGSRYYEDSSEIKALAGLTDSYKFDIEKKSHRDVLKNMVKLAEQKIENDPKMAELYGKRENRNYLIGVLALVVTLSILIGLNFYNHKANVDLDKVKVENGVFEVEPVIEKVKVQVQEEAAPEGEQDG